MRPRPYTLPTGASCLCGALQIRRGPKHWHGALHRRGLGRASAEAPPTRALDPGPDPQSHAAGALAEKGPKHRTSSSPPLGPGGCQRQQHKAPQALLPACTPSCWGLGRVRPCEAPSTVHRFNMPLRRLTARRGPKHLASALRRRGLGGKGTEAPHQLLSAVGYLGV